MGAFPSLDARFEKILSERVAHEKWGEYRKWARFHLDFCAKYGHDAADPKSLPPFLEKLKSKNQTEDQRNCARMSVELYMGLLSPEHPIYSDNKMAEASAASGNRTGKSRSPESNISSPQNHAKAVNSDRENIGACAPTSTKLPEDAGAFSSREKANAGWRDIETGLKNEIMLRHYSPKTFKTYATWTRAFRGFMINKSPDIVNGADVKAFLTDMAVQGFFGIGSKPGFQCFAFCVQACFEERVGRFVGYAAREAEQICSYSVIEKGGRGSF